MPGLIDVDTGLMEGSGLNWLEGGLGGDGLSPDPTPAGAMVTETSVTMVTETGVVMITEA